MKRIDGKKLKEMFISGGNNLYNHYAEIDALNVFPVPDGDTGMNMNLTVTSGCKEIADITDNSVEIISRTFSKGLLMGARGNSGVITSQIFRGFASGMEGKKTISPIDLAFAFEKGVEAAYKAVIKPVEGTILTVIRESSEFLSKKIDENYSMEKAMEVLIKEAKASLNRTPELLPILKDVGVVDSGGAGLVTILEGMYEGLIGKTIARNEAIGVSANDNLTAAGKLLKEEEFGYCTEFIMCLGPDSTKKPFNQAKFTETLSSKGTSLVVVRDEEIVKVHVHTLSPGGVLTYAQQFGEFLKLKIENMTEQHHALETGAQVEAHEDLVPEEEKKPFALIAVSSGDGIDDFFTEVGVSVVVKGGQTMNPSSEDFVEAIKKANAENVYIFPNNSNILMAANQACEMFEDQNVNAYVIPSKTILQGICAAINFNPEAKPEENFREMKRALGTVKSGEITFAIRDTEINGFKVNKDDFIGIYDKEIVVDNPSKEMALLELVEKMIDDDSALITLLYGEDVDKATALNIKKQLVEKYPNVDIDLREGKQPVYSFLVGVE